MRTLLFFSLIFFSFTFAAAQESPYGVYADILRGFEKPFVPRNLELMRSAGIDWIRWDWYWGTVQDGPNDPVHYDRIESVLDQVEQNGLKSLIILGYSVPWATPVCEHHEEWCEYVKSVVSRFHGRVKYWEIWNETNIESFWRSTPDPKAYAAFLKCTYETIKSIDPDAQVVYGGLAGVPFDYYEESLKAGAGEYFDVINIHPYRSGLVSRSIIERFLSDLQKFQDLTVQYTGRKKPLWITEMGWATPPSAGDRSAALIDAALVSLFPEGVPGKVAVLFDPLYPPSNCLAPEMWQGLLQTPVQCEAVLIADLKTLDPAKNPVLILPPAESFPTEAQDEIREYVKKGGTLSALGGIPFYYRMAPAEDGVWNRVETGKSLNNLPLAHSFRVHWGAWWTEEGLPKHPKPALAPGKERLLKNYAIENIHGQAFFTDQFLKDGDSLEPFLVWSEDATKTIAGLYRFRSDWKGNILLNTVPDSIGNGNRTAESFQGIYLSQAMLLALTYGVEVFFPYEFQSVEQNNSDPEHHFGLTHADLTPKTGFLAYKALTKARPAGSELIPGELFSENGNLCTLSWKRPDGQTAYAIWSPGTKITKNVEISGEVTDAFDCHGEPVKVEKTMTFGQKITYIIGENLEIQ